MTGDQVHNLKLSSEYLDVLQSMFNTEKKRVEAELGLTIKAKRVIDEVIFQLTGEEYFNNKSIKEKG